MKISETTRIKRRDAAIRRQILWQSESIGQYLLPESINWPIQFAPK